jgi:tetratricopeptide (TPR) repeat protein
VREGRFQQALELAKQVHKLEPTPAHRELVKQAYLGRARQLRESGHTRDAATVLQAARQFGDGDPAWLGQLAKELAACGEVRQALALIAGSTDEPLKTQVIGQAVDGALQQETAGRALLPEALHGDFDRVLQAFQQTEAGQDEAARETLQGIGLRSPFLEWKLLLRGLQAFYGRDDARALENWQRLAPERLPVRLAAPFRFLIDPAFRAAQPPATQAVLQKQADRLQGSGVVQQLRQVQAAMANTNSLAPAFRQAEALLSALRLEAPHLVPRLASCFYWAATTSSPDDVPRYRRVFGAPPDDPNFNRLHALAYDRAGELDEAHHYWQQYEKDVANHPEIWPGERGTRTRALLWLHLGQNAAEEEPDEEEKRLPRFLRDQTDRPAPLDPPADKCLERSLELAPDLLPAYEALFRYHLDAGHDAKAVKAARRLLERFPDHGPTLEALAELRTKQKAYAEALELFQRALKANPLERKLRGKVALAHQFLARAHAEAGRFDEARAQYQAALAMDTESKNNSTVLAKWAACEFKAGDAARGEELLQQALAQALSPLGLAYQMLVESIRLKLPRPYKPRFDREFNEGLAAAPTGAAAEDLIGLTASLQGANVTYLGQKTHQKKVLAYLDKARAADFTEGQLERICSALISLDAIKQAQKFTKLGQKKFPKSPHFPYLEAMSHVIKGPRTFSIWKVRPLLEKAERLARALPPDERTRALLEDVEERLRAMDALSPFGASFFDTFFGGDLDEDFEEEDFDDTSGGFGRPRRR